MTSDERSDDRPPTDSHEDPATGGTDSDDTTQADAGMVGGTGASPTEGTAQPFGTDPHDEDETAQRKQ